MMRRDKSNTKKSNKYPKDKSNKSRGRANQEVRDENASTYQSTNDPRWYSQYPELVVSSGNYRFSHPIGVPFNFGTSAFAKLAIPGILRIRGLLVPGCVTDAQDPFNVQLKRLYTYMRASRSGSASYDPCDIGLYLMSVGHAYAFYFWAKRLVGAVNTPNPINRYYPKYLTESMGGNYEDLHKNQADLVYYLQNYLLKLNTLYIPNGMTFLERWSTLLSNIYADKDSPRNQVYFFNPHSFDVYFEQVSGPAYCSASTTSTTGGSTVIGNNNLTFAQIVTMGDNIINHLIYSQDINQISVDIFNAYKGAVYVAAPIDMGYNLVPIHDYEMLNQFQNAQAIPDVSNLKWNTSGYWDIVNSTNYMSTIPDTNTFYCAMAVKPSSTATSDSYIYNNAELASFEIPLSVSGGFTSPEYLMTSTRLMMGSGLPVSPRSSGATTQLMWLDNVGTEMVMDFTIYTLTDTVTNGVPSIGEVTYTTFINKRNTIQDPLTLSCYAHTFDFSPAQWFYETGGSISPYVNALSFNYDYVTLLNHEELSKFHSSALMSEFYVPMP